ERMPQPLTVLRRHVVLPGEHELQRVGRGKAAEQEREEQDPEERRDRRDEPARDEATQSVPPLAPLRPGRPRRRSLATRPRLLLEPPLLDVPDRAVRRWIE